MARIKTGKVTKVNTRPTATKSARKNYHTIESEN